MRSASPVDNTRGGVHFALIFAVIVTLGVLHGVSLKRSTMGMNMVKGRYWSAAALDLAENGVEFERMLLSGGAGPTGRPPGTHRRELGKFAGYDGLFESSASALENGEHRILSTGMLLNHREVRYAVKITARIRPDAEGVWRTVHWSETTLQNGNEFGRGGGEK